MIGERPGTVTIASDERARVPFAVVGVLLVVTSAGLAAVVETRSPAERTADPATTLDSTAAAAQSALRVATTTAVTEAGRAPVTDPANTSVGRALDAGGANASVFERYVRLRIYMQARQRLAAAGQRGIDGTRTRVRLPPVGNTTAGVERAIERVDLAVGREEGTDLDPGTVRVAVEGVRTGARRGGTQVDNRTERLSTTISTPVFQLHAKTEAYDRRLEAGFLDGPGFGRQFAARLYPLVYSKAYFDRLTTAEKQFGTLAKHRHTATLANDAAFAVQESVFGTSDPARERAMRAQWACLGADIAATAAGARGGDESGDEERNDRSSGAGNATNRDEWLRAIADEAGVDPTPDRLAEVVCDRGPAVFGDADGTLPDAPPLDALVGSGEASRDALERDVSVDADDLSTYAYYDLRDLSGRDTPSFERAVGRGLAVTVENGTDPRDAAGSDASGLGRFDTLALRRAERGEIPRVISALSHVRVDPDIATRRTRTRPEAGRPDGDGWRLLWDDLRVENRNVAVSHEGVDATASTDRTRTLHSVTVTVTNELTHRKRWARFPDCGGSGNGTAADGSINGSTDGRSAENESIDGGASSNEPAERTTATDDSDAGDPGTCRIVRTTESDPAAVTYSLTADVDATHSVGAGIEHRGIRAPYERGGAPGAFTPSNFAGVPDRALEQVFGSAVDPDDVEGSLRASLSPGSITGRADLRRQVVADSGSGIVVADHGDALGPWLRSELDAVRADVADRFEDESVEISTAATLSEDDPFEPLRRTIERERDAIVYDGVGGTYDSVPAKASVRLRAAYVDAMLTWLDRVADRHRTARGSLNGRFDDASLAETVGFARDALAAEVDHDPATLPASPLVGNVTVRVDGAPTALSLDTVSRSDAPAVRPAGAGPTEPRNVTHAPLATKYTNPLPHPGLPLVPWPGYWLATVSAYGVSVEGEYARFSVRAATGDPGGGTAYVRSDRVVSLAVGGEQRRVGRVAPVDLSSTAPLVVAVPSFSKLPRGRPGVGDAVDRSASPDGESPLDLTITDCSASWGAVGPSPGERSENGTGTDDECPP